MIRKRLEAAMRIWRLCGSALLVTLVLVPSAVHAITIELNFTGSTFGTDSEFIPPDTMGAAGPDHFVELINGRYSVYRKTDGERVQTSTLNDFWRNAGATPAGAFAFDPRIVYDAPSERWFAVSADNALGPNNLLIAVSNSPNPTQGWKAFAVPSDSSGARWADFPTLGVNHDSVVVAANMFPIAPVSVNVSVLVLPKADLIAGTIADRTLFENVSPNSTGFTLQPANDPKGELPAILLSAFSTALLKRSDIVGSATSPALDVTNKFISVPDFGGSPSGIQPGNKLPLETSASLSSSTVLLNGELWGVRSVNQGGRTALQWFAINAETNVLRQSGLIADPLLSFYYGSIAVNDFGDAVIGFSGSGPSQFVSAYAVEGHTTHGVTIFGDPVLLKAGVSDYEVTFGSGRNRWGDYSATTVDPSDPLRFWTIQEWVSATDIWSTQVTAIRLQQVLEPATLLLFGTSAAGLTLIGRRKGKRHQP
jgi:hypothetical protein